MFVSFLVKFSFTVLFVFVLSSMCHAFTDADWVNNHTTFKLTKSEQFECFYKAEKINGQISFRHTIAMSYLMYSDMYVEILRLANINRLESITILNEDLAYRKIAFTIVGRRNIYYNEANDLFQSLMQFNYNPTMEEWSGYVDIFVHEATHIILNCGDGDKLLSILNRYGEYDLASQYPHDRKNLSDELFCDAIGEHVGKLYPSLVMTARSY